MIKKRKNKMEQDKTENWIKENLDHIDSIPTPEIVKQGLRADF